MTTSLVFIVILSIGCNHVGLSIYSDFTVQLTTADNKNIHIEQRVLVTHKEKSPKKLHEPMYLLLVSTVQMKLVFLKIEIKHCL